MAPLEQHHPVRQFLVGRAAPERVTRRMPEAHERYVAAVAADVRCLHVHRPQKRLVRRAVGDPTRTARSRDRPQGDKRCREPPPVPE